MPVTWQARPVFVSSTFLDMHAERDHLRAHVFPELEERLQAHNAHLEWVDLRLGIVAAADADESATEAQVLKVCLDEVQRCRPFLLVLLGERYGWVPPSERFADAVREAGVHEGLAPCSVTELEIEAGVMQPPTLGSSPPPAAPLRSSFADMLRRLFAPATPHGPPIPHGPSPPATRCLFYLRAPLANERMSPQQAAQYVDAPGSPGAQRMGALRQRIEAAFPGRVRYYRATWDAEHQRVSGLEAFGHRVLEDLWAQLAEHIPQAAPAASWADAERQALEAFAADRARDFVGRERTLSHLMHVATSRDEPIGEPGHIARGACLTGAPGSGKSALWCALRRQLMQGDVFVLAHAVGASPASTLLDNMLRRFVDEMQVALSLPPGDDAASTASALQERFTALLAKLTARRRVVVLVDGADQFEDTTRARLHTWLPRPWPANARLIATAAPGDSAQALATHPGLRTTALPPLDTGEARLIAKAISARYHRTLEPDVVAALLDVPAAEGPASGNALWLVNATEEVNLLDADDFERAGRSTVGTPAQRLRALLLDRVGELPGDVAALYGLSFAKAQELFGAPMTRSFVGLIALSRDGWRESDLRALVPRLAGQPWDGLRFAALRRHFRGQLEQRTRASQWEFRHAQMRQAALALLDSAGVAVGAWHAAIADHLLALDAGDALRAGQTMHHLLAARNWARAASYVSDAAIDAEALDAASVALAAAMPSNASTSGAGAIDADVIDQLLDAASADEDLQLRLARRLLFDLEDHLDGRATLAVRMALLDRVEPVVRRAAGRTPPAADAVRDLAICGLRRGRLTEEMGDVAGAITAMREALTVLAPLRDAHPGIVALGWRDLGNLLFFAGRHDLALQALQQAVACDERALAAQPAHPEHQASLAQSHERMGRVLMNSGQREAALDTYARSGQILQALLEQQPRNLAWRDALARSLEGVAEAAAASGRRADALDACDRALAVMQQLAADEPELTWVQSGLALSHERLGDEQLAVGDWPQAQASCEQSLAIRERLAATDPADAALQRHIANSLERLASCFDAQGDGARAQKLQERALAILRPLVAGDPGNLDWRLGLANLLMHQGDRLAAQERRDDALAAYREALEHCAQLAPAAPDERRVKRLLGACELKMGDALDDLGRSDEALACYRRVLDLRQALSATDPGNAGWRDDVAVAHNRIGRVLAARGERDEALAAYQQALALASPLADANPGDAMRQFNIGILHGCIGELLDPTQPVEALREYQAQAGIVDTLADGGPMWQGAARRCHERLREFTQHNEATLGVPGRMARAHSLTRIGALHAAQDSTGAARQAYGEALVVLHALADDEAKDGARLPMDAALPQALMRVYAAIGDLHVAAGEGEAAVAARQQQVRFAEAVAACEPGDSDVDPELSWAYNQLASLLQQLGQIPQALGMWQRDLELDRRRVAAAPDDSERAWDLSISLNHVGDALLAMEQAGAALPLYRESLALRDRLCPSRPADTEWHRARIVGINRVTKTLTALARHEEALAECDRAIQAAGKLAAGQPDRPDWQEGLAQCHVRRAEVLSALGRHDDAEADLQRAQALVAGLRDAREEER